MNKLRQYRQEIDKIDKRLIDTLIERMFVSQKIGEYKKTHNLNIIDFTRFHKTMEDKKNHIVEAGLGNMYILHISDIYNLIHKFSIKIQEEI